MNLNYQLGWADDSFIEEFYKVTKESVIPQSILFNRDGNITGVFTSIKSSVIKSMKESVDKTVNE